MKFTGTFHLIFTTLSVVLYAISCSAANIYVASNFGTLSSPQVNQPGTHLWNFKIFGYAFRSLNGSEIIHAGVEKFTANLYALASNEEEKQTVKKRLGIFFVIGYPSLRFVHLTTDAQNLSSLKLRRNKISGYFEKEMFNVLSSLTYDNKTGYIISISEKPAATGSDADISSSSSDEEKASITKDYTASRIYLTPEKGYVIISDLDDTIKVTGVNNINATKLNTFVKPFTATSSSSERYQAFRDILTIQDENSDDKIQPLFYYLSGSPWPMANAIQEFLDDNRFPRGPLRLRHFSLFDLSLFKLSDQESIRQYKEKVIEEAISRLPHKKFVLIGDSTQQDPEVYATMYRKYSSQISCIFIRKVVGFNEETEAKNNKPERFIEAFQKVTDSKWFVFDDFSQLAQTDIPSGVCRPN